MVGVAPRLIDTTYHSRIEEIQVGGTRAVRKTANRNIDRTVRQWETEVKAMKIALVKGSLLQQYMAMLIDSNQDDLSITMRLENGQSLDRHVSDTMMCTLSTAQADVVWQQMAAVLEFLHYQGIIHDDVKPENIIWVAAEDRAVLIDFGAAIILAPGEKAQFHPSGTPPYAPPEYLQKRKGPEGDIWGLGITILYAKQYIRLPDGEWRLDRVFEHEEPRTAMLAWLDGIENLRGELESSQRCLADMLLRDPAKRISAADLAGTFNAKPVSD